MQIRNIGPKSFVAQALAKQNMLGVTCWFAELETLCANEAHGRNTTNSRDVKLCQSVTLRDLGKYYLKTVHLKGAFEQQECKSKQSAMRRFLR